MIAAREIRRREPHSALYLPDSLHPVLRRVLAARIQEPENPLALTLKDLLPPTGLQNIDMAAGLIAEAVMRQQRILIVGDFDADGATSTALSVRALRAMGATDVRYLVPNRFEYGYGLSPEIVELALRESPDLLVTVDNGISSLDGVAAANRAGVPVVITDHHLPGATLPAAAALVNPNLPGCNFPSKHLAGVGVAFYVMSAVRQRLEAAGWFNADRPKPNLAKYLDLVALGTVADVVPLDRNNRILVEQGLRRIRAGAAAPGVLSLFAVCGRDYRRAVSSDLGFAIGPRLNAAGRLDCMSIGIECLLADEPAKARVLAEQLDQLNRERQEIEQSMRQEADAQLETLREKLSRQDSARLPAALVLYDPTWHQGVIGILAGRVKERWHRPTIVFAEDSDGMLKGSGRSIPGLHLRDALEIVDARHPGMISKFGGHAMAAGLSLPTAALPAFKQAFVAVVEELVSEEDLVGVILSDGPLQAEEITLELAELLRVSIPWGQHFPEPVFDGVFDIQKVVPIGGGRHQRLELRPAGATGQPLEAVMFNTREDELPAGRRWHIAYKLGVNTFRGLSRCQLMIEYACLPADMVG